MRRVIIPLLLIVMGVAGCTAASSKIRNARFEEQLRQAIKQHPEIVLDALAQNKMSVLSLVEQGVRERQALKREAGWRAQAAAPLKPVIGDERPVYGNKDAAITIVEYSDFFCSYCGRGKKTVKQLVDESNGKLRAVFKHVPLHSGADTLAAMFEAVGMQNPEKAWIYAEKLFERQSLFMAPGKAAMNQLLRELDVDIAKAWKDADSPKVKERIEEDRKEAEKFGVTGTPTYVVGGITVRGALPKRDFERALEILEEGAICEDCLE